MKLPPLSPTSRLELKMTPMIDVVFLLLVFFIWTSSFEIPEFDLPGAIAQPPQASRQISNALPPPSEPFDEIVIRLGRSGAEWTITLNGNPVDSLAQLNERLTEIIALGVQPAVIIDPDDAVTMNMTVAAYDAARDAGADRVLLAARAE